MNHGNIPAANGYFTKAFTALEASQPVQQSDDGLREAVDTAIGALRYAKQRIPAKLLGPIPNVLAELEAVLAQGSAPVSRSAEEVPDFGYKLGTIEGCKTCLAIPGKQDADPAITHLFEGDEAVAIMNVINTIKDHFALSERPAAEAFIFGQSEDVSTMWYVKLPSTPWADRDNLIIWLGSEDDAEVVCRVMNRLWGERPAADDKLRETELNALADKVCQDVQDVFGHLAKEPAEYARSLIQTWKGQ